MEDAVRPSETAFKAVYERGYRTWATIWEKAAVDELYPKDCLSNLYASFPDHPYFPDGLTLDKSLSNTVIAKGKTTWTTSQGLCDLSPFQEEVVFQVASSSVTTIAFVPSPHPATKYTDYICSKSNHVPILTLAWAYILSARWTELISGARAPAYSNHEGQPSTGTMSRELEQGTSPIVVDVGDVDGDAARWWTAILSADGGWYASIQSDTGFNLHSPWAIRTQPGSTFHVSAKIQPHSNTTNFRPPSFSTAIRYLSDYCSLHDAADHSQAALAAALLIPVAKLDNRRIELPVLPLPRKAPYWRERKQATSAWDGELCQLDQLLTLSCNSRGVKSLLNSVFFDPDVACNVCGAWLQGSFAFLDSDKAKDPYRRLQTFMNRDPGLSFLWLGAFITGAEGRCLQEARSGWWKVDLNAAAWTRTHVSFIQGFVTKPAPGSQQVSRANECRLLYLSHEQDHAIPPLFPFAPFGSTAFEDTDLDVRRHARCSPVHGLVYDGFAWDCNGGRKVDQRRNDALAATIRHKAPQPPGWNSSATVIYDSMDIEDEVSEMVTRNIFTWLRGDNGFPVAERAIREHEWIDNLDSDHESLIEGDVRSTAGGNLGSWLLGLSTRRSNSF